MSCLFARLILSTKLVFIYSCILKYTMKYKRRRVIRHEKIDSEQLLTINHRVQAVYHNKEMMHPGISWKGAVPRLSDLPALV